MADEIDIAQEINETNLADALADHQRRMPSGESLEFCIDCEEEIPEARRKAMPGCKRCISCQEEHEMLSHWRPM